MASDLPLTFRASPLPVNFRGTPQQFLDALVARLSVETQAALSLFVSGATPPTSNQGPWLKNGVTWYVWDAGSGAYVPEVIEFRSLRYVAQFASPDPSLYTFWIVLDGSGKAQGIQYYSGGAWHDVYQDIFYTKAQTDAQIATGLNAVLADLESYPCSAVIAGTQSVPMDGSVNKVSYDTVVFDPSSRYDTGNKRYTAAAAGYYCITAKIQIDNDTAVAADMDVAFFVGKNGAAQSTCSGGTAVATPPGSRWYPAFSGMIQLNANDYVEVFIQGAATGNVNLSNGDWSIHRVKKA